MKAARNLLLSFVLVLLYAGCGGGGSGESGVTMVGSGGGTFRFDGGVVLEVPPGALSTPRGVTVQLLNPAGAQALMDESGMQERLFMAGALFSPSGLTFNLPVRVTLPAASIPGGSRVPVHFVLDDDTNAYYPADTKVTVDPAAGTVTLDLAAFSSHAVASVADTSLAQRCIDAGEDPCRCATFTVETVSRDTLYTSADGTCSASLDTGTITYQTCEPVQTESWGFVEHSDGCVPRLTLTPDKTAVIPGETTAVSAGVIYGVDPVRFQEVSLTSNDLMTLSARALTTDGAGEASFEATAGSREGEGVVEGTTTVEYVPVEIVINGQPEPWPMDPRQKTVTARTSIAIDAPLSLEVSIVPGVYGNYLIPGEKTMVSVAILDPDPNNGTFHFVPEAGVLLSVSAGVLDSPAVSTTSLGEVSVGFTAPGSPGPVAVLADAVVEVADSAGQPAVYVLNGQDTIEVLEKPVERWSGVLEIVPYMDMGYDPLNPGYTPASAEVSVYIPFTLDIDPDVVNPGPGNPNALGTGGATVDVFTTDSDIRYYNGQTSGDQEFWDGTTTHPFTATLEGVVSGSGSGRRMDLAVRHPDGEGSTIATAQLATRYYDFSNGTVTEELFGFPFWLEWRDFIHMNNDNLQVPIPVAIGNRTSVTTGGDCMYDLWTQCTYTLTMTRE